MSLRRSGLWLPESPQSRPNRVATRLGDEIALLSACVAAARARLLAHIREFDARSGWNILRALAHLARGLNLGAARERVRVARALGSLPLLSAAPARGELSCARVRLLACVAAPETERRLLNAGRAGTACRVERIVRRRRRVNRQTEAREGASRHAHRGLSIFRDEDSSMVLRGRPTPEASALPVKALDVLHPLAATPRRPAGG